MDRKTVLISGIGHINLSNKAYLEALDIGLDVIAINDYDFTPIKPPSLKVTTIDCGMPRKIKKDKSKVKRYSSYFNKLKT